MVNTILTDDEIDAICDRVLDTNGHTCGSLIARAIEAAVLAKLREQQPVAWGIVASNTGRICQLELNRYEVESFNPEYVVPLYAAPQPAVAQVPQEARDAINGEWNACMFRGHCRALLAAAPEAPALPAEVREALKVAREALEAMLENRGDYTANRDAARAAIARIDALGGGQS